MSSYGTLVEVGEATWAWIQTDGSWWVNNAGYIADPGGDIVVDTCATSERTRAFLAAGAAASVSGSIAFAVNTHLHGDHTYGNSELPLSTTVIGHEAMRDGLIEDTMIDACPPMWTPLPEWGPVVKRLPDVTYRDRLTLHGAAREIEVRHLGFTAHTSGDSLVWVPSSRVLYAGDLLFHDVTPLVIMGSVSGAIAALDHIKTYPAEKIVPGHGPVIALEDVRDVLDQHRAYYEHVQRTADLAVNSALSPLEAAREIGLGDFAAWPDSERLVLNTHGELAARRGEAVDLEAAFLDALEWNGGPLHTSVNEPGDDGGIEIDSRVPR